MAWGEASSPVRIMGGGRRRRDPSALTRGPPAPLILDGALALPMRGATSSLPPQHTHTPPPPPLAFLQDSSLLFCPPLRFPSMAQTPTLPFSNVGRPLPSRSPLPTLWAGWREGGGWDDFTPSWLYSKNSIHFGAPWGGGGSERARRQRGLSLSSAAPPNSGTLLFLFNARKASLASLSPKSRRAFALASVPLPRKGKGRCGGRKPFTLQSPVLMQRGGALQASPWLRGSKGKAPFCK